MKLTTTQVHDFLHGHYTEPISNVASLSGGNWSQAFGFDRNHRPYVIRFGQHVADYLKDRVAAGFNSPGLPIPQVLEIGEAFDAYFAVSEQAFGTMLDQLSPQEMKQLVPAVLDMFDAMRQVDLSSYVGFGLWDDTGQAPYTTWKSYLLQTGFDDPAKRIHGWRAKLAASPIGDAAFNNGLAKLEELVAFCPNDKHLIHTDLLNSNAMVKDNQISAIFDWGNALCGDFLYDLACFAYWSSELPAMADIDWEAEAEKHFAANKVEVPHFKERMLCYKLQISLDDQSYNAFIENWEHLKSSTDHMADLLKSNE